MSKARSLKVLLLQMKLDSNPEMRILAEELIIDQFSQAMQLLEKCEEVLTHFHTSHYDNRGNACTSDRKLLDSIFTDLMKFKEEVSHD